MKWEKAVLPHPSFLIVYYKTKVIFGPMTWPQVHATCSSKLKEKNSKSKLTQFKCMNWLSIPIIKNEEFMLSLTLFTRYRPVPFVMPVSPRKAWLRPIRCDAGNMWLRNAKLANPLPPLGVVCYNCHTSLSLYTNVHATHGMQEKGMT